MPARLMHKVRKTIDAHEMLKVGDKVVVAVSGGPDSVCLLDVLEKLAPEYKIRLIVAHFDHTLRPHEDEEETEFVRQLARQYGIEFHTAKASETIHSSKGSLEERARKQRYAFLEQVRAKTNANKIALGHQLNDQAETVILRLLRGSGMQGLAGILPVRDRVFIRPLLSVSRQEIIRYLAHRGLKWVDDSSNLSTDPLRNRIRLELIPLLQSYQPRIVEILARTADTLQLDNSFLEDCAAGWLEKHTIQSNSNSVSLHLNPLLALHPSLQRRVLRAAIKKLTGSLRKISHANIVAALGILHNPAPQSELHLARRILIKKRYNRIIVERKDSSVQEDFTYQIERPGVYSIKEINGCLYLTELRATEELPLASSPWEAFLDAEKLHYPLTIRPFRPGDRMIPLGMKGRKKVQDLFVDNKVPLELRTRIPLVFSKGEIAWVPGIRIGENYKVTPNTSKVLKLRFEGKILSEFQPG